MRGSKRTRHEKGGREGRGKRGKKGVYMMKREVDKNKIKYMKKRGKKREE